MNRPDRIKELFLAAIELPTGERAAFLARACAGDDAMLAELLELLAAHDDAGSFLAEPGGAVRAAVGAAAEVAESAGETIGAYKLVERIGEGTFGTVWVAEQREPVRRAVALKILKAGMDTAQVVARFEQERQALAVMAHPNIAQVFDAGTTKHGRPFFVMELVKGVPLTDYVRQHRLSLQARLELFVQVCRAVQHAHGKGVIHRDLKPGNVLVATADGRPLAKVIDFGVAKATGARLTEKTLLTEHRGMVGTLAYMSPEQAEGLLDVDTRSDVYSLGAMLYELLTGGTPFDVGELREQGLREMLRVLREVDPQRPSVRVSSQGVAAWAGGPGQAVVKGDAKALFGALRGDLDWVVLKALEKERGRRYASAEGLAEDVERYLVGDAVMAVPPSVGYRVRKFVRRHRAAVGSVAAVLVAVLVGAVVVAVSWRQREVEQLRAEGAEVREGEQRVAARFASYANSVRSALENGLTGNREMALRGLADRVIAWGANTSGDRLVLVKSESKNRRVVTTNENGGPSHSTKYDTSDRLLVVDGMSGIAHVAWEFPVVLGGSSPWHGHRPWISEDGQLVLLAPESRNSEFGPVSGQRVAALDIAARELRSYDAIPEEGIVAVSERNGLYIVMDPVGHITAKRWSDGSTAWRLPEKTPHPHYALLGEGGDRMMTVYGSDRIEAIAIGVSDGSVLWPQPALIRSREDDMQEGSLGSTSRMKIIHTPDPSLVACFEDYSAPEDTDGVSAVFLRSDNGAAQQGHFWPLSWFHAGQHGSSMAVEMLTMEKERRFSLADRRSLIGDRCHFRDDGELVALGKWDGKPALFINIGSTEFFGPGVVGSALYEGGWSDMCLETHELRVHPRHYAGTKKTSLRSGLAVIQPHEGIVIVADRPADVFPPAPLGDERSVATLGLWQNQPAAIYPGGITTLDCEASARVPIEGGPEQIDGAASNAAGTVLAIVSGSSLRVFDTTTGIDRGKPMNLEGTTRAVAVTPSADHVATLTEAADGSLLLATFAVGTGITLHRVPLPAASGASPQFGLAATEGRLAVTAGSRPLRLFTLPELQEIAVPTAATMPATCLQFDRAGDRLAIGRLDGRVDLLHRDGTLIPIPTAHVGGVLAVAWSSDGSRLFTAGADRFVRLWDPVRGLELLNLGDNTIPGKPGFRAFDGVPCCLFATPDDERLFCGYTDGAVRVWDTVPWLERVARRRAREATAPPNPNPNSNPK
ncbi:MAG: serine/threonine-protein kinase [Planctomycetes bacterium]|nr:serine/threonine-protein kinase [Planctomycetota bacterium]